MKGRVVSALHILTHPFPAGHTCLFNNCVVRAGDAVVSQKGTVGIQRWGQPSTRHSVSSWKGAMWDAVYFRNDELKAYSVPG